MKGDGTKGEGKGDNGTGKPEFSDRAGSGTLPAHGSRDHYGLIDHGALVAYRLEDDLKVRAVDVALADPLP